MTKKTLIICSAIRDGLNWMFIGQIPGLGQLLDVPLLVMHFRYAGASASYTLLELIPTVGLVPIFTIAACCYPDHDAPIASPKPPAPTAAAREILPVRTASARPEPAEPYLSSEVIGPVMIPAPGQPGVYAYVDGKMTPVRVTSEQMDRIVRRVRRMTA